MSSRWPGSLINGIAPTSSGGGAQDSAPGVWTLDQANPYIASQTWPGTGVPDPQFQYVTALLHGDGVNAAQNNTFLDSSSNNFTITRNGNTTQGSFSPYGPLWSVLSTRSATSADETKIEISSSTGLGLASNDFCIEMWVYFTNSYTGDGPFCTTVFGSGYIANTWWFGPHSANSGRVTVFDYNYSNSAPLMSESTSPPINQWTHYALVRNGNSFTIYRNGTSTATATFSGAFAGSSSGLLISRAGDAGSVGNNSFGGYLSNLRVVNGSSVYTSNFTPSTSPLTAITNTGLLTLQSNRFIDNSANALTVTPSGVTSVQRFSPFQNLATYQTAKIGGSGYFGGVGNYLQIQNSNVFDTDSTFTIGCWFYQPSAGDANFFSRGGGAASWSTSNGHQFLLFIASGDLYWMWNAGGSNTQIQTAAPAAGQWHYLAVGYNGTTTRFWLNGVSVGTSTTGYTMPTTRNIVRAGYSPSSEIAYTGFESDLIFVKGTDVYGVGNSTITVPTTPLTAITNTALLLSYTNGAIYDNAAMNNLETVGSAQISTSTYKYGTGSIATSAAGNYLSAPSTPNMVLNGNFTIECWVYPTATAGSSGTEIASYGASGQFDGWHFYQLSSTNYLGFGLNYAGVIVSSSIAITLNTWSHVAVSRIGTTYLLFINGNQVGSATSSTTQSTNSGDLLRIGTGSYSQAADRSFIGYIDDFRITNGYARYWFNFQPPAAPFPNYGGTLQLTYDPYFSNTTLLLNGEGTNGAQNNTFLDSSTNNFTITRNGNTTQGSFSPYGTLWSNYFDGSGAYISAPSNSAFNLGTGEFTIECWIYLTAFPFYEMIVGRQNYSNATGWGVWIDNGNSNKLGFWTNAGANKLAGNTPPLNTWQHIAVVRNSSNVITLYQNGVATASTSLASFNDSSTNLNIGGNDSSNWNANYPVNGYISNVRVVKGTAVYTSTFTPPTSPLTAITNTSLLTCQSNRFIDNSSNAFSLTLAGTPQVQRFSPFNPTAPYSTSVIGGSGYFDGSGDSLTAPQGAAFQFAGDFTIECWVYAFNAGGGSNYDGVFDTRSGNIVSSNSANINYTPGGYLNMYVGGTNAASSTLLGANRWVYVAMVRSGSTVTLYQNGVSVATVSTSANLNSGYCTIGGFISSGYWNGYISDVRVVNGTAIYTSNFIPPTAPLTAITNTQLLTNMTNAGIPDLAMQTDYETRGNVAVSTTQYKYGTGSLYFDGTTSSYMTSTNPPNGWAFGTGDFTVELWAYPIAATNRTIMANRSGGTGFSTHWSLEFFNTANILEWHTGLAIIASSNTAITLNTWTHIAVTRNSGTLRIFQNGNQVASASDSNNYSLVNPLLIGYEPVFPSTNGAFYGYMEDIRITKGLARYVQNFTPPTAALPTY